MVFYVTEFGRPFSAIQISRLRKSWTGTSKKDRARAASKIWPVWSVEVETRV